MPVAATYEIHGNLPDLEAVPQEIRKANADSVVVCGAQHPTASVRGGSAEIIRERSVTF